MCDCNMHIFYTHTFSLCYIERGLHAEFVFAVRKIYNSIFSSACWGKPIQAQGKYFSHFIWKVWTKASPCAASCSEHSPPALQQNALSWTNITAQLQREVSHCIYVLSCLIICACKLKTWPLWKCFITTLTLTVYIFKKKRIYSWDLITFLRWTFSETM